MIQNNGVLHHFNEQIKRPIDRKFVEDVVLWVKDFARKSDRLRDHISFLGGNLIGVYPFIMLSEDISAWRNDVLQIDDYDKLQYDIYNLPDINRSFKVSSDATNLSFLWVVYKALSSTTLSIKDKDLLAINALMGLQYKFVSSLHTRRFPYPADEGLSQMVYESLDNKSQLKKCGSWQAVLDMRAESILGPDALHNVVLRSLEPDHGLVLALNDMETRLRSLIQGLTNTFHDLKEKQSKLITTTKFTVLEGEAILKDSVNDFMLIRGAMVSIIPDKNNFIKPEILEAVISTVKTAHYKHVNMVLEFLSENYTVDKIKNNHINIEDLLSEIITFVLTLIKRENIHLSNIPEVAMKLKSVLASSRFKSDEYADIKEKMDFIVEYVLVKAHENTIVSTRIAVVFYIGLRSLLVK